MEQVSREHHYVPKCLLKRFTNEDGFLHGYLREENRFVRRVPKKIFVRTDLHNQINDTGVINDVVEQQLSKCESKAAPILNLLVRAARLGVAPSLSQEQYETWTAFFLLQWKRAPEFQDRAEVFSDFERTLNETLDRYEQEVRPLTEAEREQFSDPGVVALMRHNVRAMNMLRLSERALNAIRARGIALVRVRAVGESLLIGSNPVMKLTPNHTNDLADHGVEVWLPIAPDVLVGVGEEPNSVRVVDAVHLPMIQSINDDLLRQSSIVAGRSKLAVKTVLERNGVGEVSKGVPKSIIA